MDTKQTRSEYLANLRLAENVDARASNWRVASPSWADPAPTRVVHRTVKRSALITLKTLFTFWR